MNKQERETRARTIAAEQVSIYTAAKAEHLATVTSTLEALGVNSNHRFLSLLSASLYLEAWTRVRDRGVEDSVRILRRWLTDTSQSSSPMARLTSEYQGHTARGVIEFLGGFGLLTADDMAYLLLGMRGIGYFDEREG